MIKVFDKTKEYEHYSQGGLISGELCYVEEDKTVHFRTNNIDGADKTYDMGEGSGSSAVLISGSFTENGSYQPEEADGYSEVTINVPIPEGYIVPSGSKSISLNGTGIDVTQYATVDVAVPASGITPTGSLSITENGSFDVTNYAGANVNVPIPAGYIVPSGNKAISNNGNAIDVTQFETVSVNVPASAVVSGSKSISANGSNIDVTNYAAVDVNVPIPAGYIVPSGTKSISENGNNIDVTAFASVNVNVSSSGITPSGTYSITENGTYDVTQYASASVNVSGGGAPQWETVQADGTGQAYIPCAENDVLYYESTEYMGDPYMFMNSSMTPIGEGYNAGSVACSPWNDNHNAQSWIVCVKDAFGSGMDFSSCAYAMVYVTANATIRYKKMNV